MTSSAQLEREAEQTRSELTRTLNELRDRMTPGQLADQAFDYAKDSTGGDFLRNLGRQMATNPLPVVLAGAGITWLAFANRNSGSASPAATGAKGAASVAERMSEGSSQASDKAAATGQHASDVAGSLGESAGEVAPEATSMPADSEGAAPAYGSMKSAANSTAAAASNVAADAYGQVADTADRASSAAAQSAKRIGQKASGFGGSALALCKGQPLILGGLGLALGAVLGAVISPTDAENRLMGKTSERIKQQARRTAEEQIESVKTAVDSAWSRRG